MNVPEATDRFARPNADIHVSPERVPGAFFRAMGAHYFKGHPDSSQEFLARDLGRRLAARGIEYHIRTLKRQLTGAVSSVPPEVEAEMCQLLTAGDTPSGACALPVAVPVGLAVACRHPSLLSAANAHAPYARGSHDRARHRRPPP